MPYQLQLRNDCTNVVVTREINYFEIISAFVNVRLK